MCQLTFLSVRPSSVLKRRSNEQQSHRTATKQGRRLDSSVGVLKSLHRRVGGAGVEGGRWKYTRSALESC